MLGLLLRMPSFWDLPCHQCRCYAGWRVRRAQLRRYSITAVAHCRRCGFEQFLKKVRRKDAASESDIQREYETMRMMNGGDRTNFTYLFPLAYEQSTRTRAFSSQYVGGQSLDQMLNSAGTQEDILMTVQRAGRWLKGFHSVDLSRYCGASATSDLLLGRIREKYERLTNAPRELTQAVEAMRFINEQLAHAPIRPIALHGDYKASNLICDEQGRLYGIDFIMRSHGPGEMDIAQFIIDMMLNRYGATLANGNYLPGLLDIFLTAYNNNTSEHKGPVIFWLFYFLVSQWTAKLSRPWIWQVSNGAYRVVCADLLALTKQLSIG